MQIDLVQFFPDGIAGGCHAVLVDQTRLAQLFHDNRHTADLIEILGHIGAAGLEIDKIGRVAENFANVLEEEIDARFMCHGRQVQTGIG